MKYDPYILTELIRNDDFIAWVKHPDEESDRFWQGVMRDNPRKRKIIEAARGYVILLAEDTGKHFPTPPQSEKMWDAVQEKLKAAKAEKREAPPDPENPPRSDASGFWTSGLKVAASLVLAAGAAVWYYGGSTPHHQAAEQQQQTVQEAQPGGYIERRNQTPGPVTILLPDGTSVVLQPGGRLRYGTFGANGRREVMLSGGAFFEVAHNPSKPFFVYTHRLTTKVLGTSFGIDAPEGEEQVKVAVKTGRVSVVRGAPDEDRKAGGAESAVRPGEYILRRNESRVFYEKEGRLEQKRIAPAAIKTGDIYTRDFVFEETSVGDVFLSLEHAYGIRIVYDRETLGPCPLTATLTGQPLEKKLGLICNALGATYAIHGDRIEVTGPGCG